jgi:hypothetical protein
MIPGSTANFRSGSGQDGRHWGGAGQGRTGQARAGHDIAGKGRPKGPSVQCSAVGAWCSGVSAPLTSLPQFRGTQPNTGAYAIMGTVDPESFDTLHSFANAFEMPFVTPWFPEKTEGILVSTFGV